MLDTTPTAAQALANGGQRAVPEPPESAPGPDPTPAPPPAPAPAPDARKRSTLPGKPRIERWFDLPGFDGWKVKLWLTYPKTLMDDVTSGDNERGLAAISQIVLEHNGWPDDEGYELPPPSDRAFWDGANNYAIAAVMQLLQDAPGKLAAGEIQSKRRL